MTTTVTTHADAAANPGPLDIHCQTASSFSELAGFRAEWDAFVQRVGGDIYLTYDWCRIWWEHYGSGRRLVALIFRDGQRIVGVLPIFVERIWLGLVWVKVAKIIGSDSSLTLCNPPVQPEYAGLIFEAVLEHLLGRVQCDAVQFGPLAGTYEPVGALREVCHRRSDLAVIARDAIIGVHTSFLVPETIDEYLKSLGKKTRANYRRQLRQMEERYRVCSETITDAEGGLRELTKMVVMHGAQWKAQGKLGHFGDWPGSISFNRDLVRHFGSVGLLRMLKTCADDRPISYHYGYEFGGCYYWRLPARVTGAEWDEYGLGNIGIVQKMEMSVVDRVRRIEAGIGHYDYKLRWGGQEYPLHSVLVVANRWKVRTRAAIFRRVADILHLIYYRIWFLRVAPKLPFRRRPLRRLWIRTRL